MVTCPYPGNGGPKTYEVDPHKLVNLKGVWYLAARHDGRLKTFSFSKLDLPAVTDTVFEPDPKLLEQLQADDGIWTSDKPIEVVLTVVAQAAPYFRRRKPIANQVIDKELADGGLIVSAKVCHANQVLPIVRYWIPHLRIIAPQELSVELDRVLREFVAGSGTAGMASSHGEVSEQRGRASPQVARPDRWRGKEFEDGLRGGRAFPSRPRKCPRTRPNG